MGLRGTALLACVAITSAACGLFPDTAPTEWVLLESPEEETLRLRVVVGSPCDELRPVEVEETPSTVTIRTSVRLGDDPCAAALGTEDIDVKLEEPLGERELRGCIPEHEDTLRAGGEQPNPDCRLVNR